MNLNDVSTQLLYTTVPVWVEYSSGQQGSGSGFIFSIPSETNSQESIPFLVTNYHVIKNAKRGLVEFVERSGDQPALGKRTRVEIPIEVLLHFNDQQNDLAAFPIGPILNQLEQSSRGVFFRGVTPDLIPNKEVVDSLAAIEEITFIGYPSGLYDEHNIIPIVRRGITATPVWNDFQGQPYFLIDAGVFPGSSGSPVFLLNQGGYHSAGNFIVGTRIHFLGILSESMVRVEKNTPNVFLGLGKVVKSTKVLSFLNNIVSTFTSGAPR